jgi:hypothetical protein
MPISSVEMQGISLGGGKIEGFSVPLRRPANARGKITSFDRDNNLLDNRRAKESQPSFVAQHAVKGVPRREREKT